MLGGIASKPEHARLYFRFHPARIPLAADPDMITFRAYGVPKPRSRRNACRPSSPCASIRTVNCRSQCRSRRWPRPSTSWMATSSRD